MKIEKLIEDLGSKKPKVKYGASKKIIALAKENPKTLLEKTDFFFELLRNPNKIMVWTAIDALGGIALVASKKDFDRIYKTLVQYLDCGNMITSGHATVALGNIAREMPEHREEIVKELVKIADYKFDTTECGYIATGHAIAVIQPLANEIKNKNAIISMCKKASKIPRPATQKKAEKLLNSLENK